MTTFRNPTDHTGVTTESESEREEREAVLAGMLTESMLVDSLAADLDEYIENVAEWLREVQAFGLADAGPFAG